MTRGHLIFGPLGGHSPEGGFATNNAAKRASPATPGLRGRLSLLGLHSMNGFWDPARNSTRRGKKGHGQAVVLLDLCALLHSTYEKPVIPKAIDEVEEEGAENAGTIVEY